ncbi:hypothetical protein [Paenibacillus tepidiphilus]|uniref:hypothetical protein n=1 Tax=Paenibacillus tepidiphilus TaxID=2608683 RepID=UPI00123928AF|nr:hypothetical protein [Paenibacillus tepidiphilus]
MKTILPVTYPPITSFPHIANILSFLWVNEDKVLPWLCDRYLQLTIRPYHPMTRADFYEQADTDNYIIPGYSCPFFGWLRNNQTTAHFVKFTDYIEYQINQGYYLDACLDNFYLRCSLSFEKEHFIHTTFIYGFDNEKELIYISDFYDNGKYVRETASYEEINKSIEGIDYLINLYKYQDFNYIFNINLLKTFIEDYINCRDSLKKFEFSCASYNRDNLYGLNFYDYIIDVFCKENKLDLRPFHIIYDQKVMMRIRLGYLFKLNIFDNKVILELKERNDVIIKNSIILRNLAIKYNLTYDNRLIHKIIDKCNSIKISDQDLMMDLLNCLK